MSKGGVFVISGPSGSGKDTLLVKLFERMPELKFSISCITRAMRQGEKQGEKYNFISKQQFQQMLDKDEFLEHNSYVGNYYGTPKHPVLQAIEQGEDMVIEVDVNGAKQIREKLPEVVSIFIMPPSFEELKARLSGRGTESEAAVKERMENSLKEIERASEYDYIIINDDIDTAVRDIQSVILSNRLSLKRTRYIIDEVLKKC
ncbi:MAG: guanylate kinase [Clostridia bacterium]|nr:guanylate kinase [Clostridia bacterium]